MAKFLTYSSCYSSLLRLAFPVVASQAGNMLTVMADTLMVGALGETELAAVSFSGNLSVPIMFAGMGIALCITPLVGKRFGGCRLESIALCLKHLKAINILTALTQLAVLTLIWILMPYMGQPDEVVEIAQCYFPILFISIFPAQMFTGYKQFIEGLQNTKIPMTISLIGNMMNIVLNYVLIYGFWFVEPIGVNGAAWSTLISRIFMWVAISIVVRRIDLSSKYFTLAKQIKFSFKIFRRILHLGIPIGGQMVVECIAFAFGGIMMGWIGTSEIAAHEIVMTFTSLTYLMASGISSAITIRVSLFNGQRDYFAVRQNSLAALQLAVMFMGVTAIMFVTLRNIIPSLIIDSPSAVNVASGLMIIAGAFQLFDGLQVTTLGILRGAGDISFPAMISGVAYIATCLPIGFLLSFVFDFGANGIWIGYLIGLALASFLLLSRFRRKILSKDIKY